MPRSLAPLCLLLLAASTPRLARAADAPPAPASPPSEAPSPAAPPPAAPGDESEKGLWDAKPAARRSGFTAGLMLGMAFGTVGGYPNDFSKLDNDAYRSATSGVGGGGMFYLGGALTDWFTFSVGFSQSSYGGTRNLSEAWAILFHIETFPLFSLGNFYRDIGLYADVGTGQATIKRRSDLAEFSSSGSTSAFGVGAFWETWRLAGHIAVGPVASWQYETSDSMTRTYGQLGVRASVYGGP